jgi:hypothetical protein
MLFIAYFCHLIKYLNNNKMKKVFILFMGLVLSSALMAKDFVMISYSGISELERLFSDQNLKVHYYTDSEVFATAEHFDSQTMVLLDHQAFEQNEVYTLVYCPQTEQQAYIGDGEALLQTADYVIVKGGALPYKNDGAVAIFNKEARLPRLTRDFPTVTEVNPTIFKMLNQVNRDSLEATVQHLQNYGSRVWNSENAFAASDWIAGRMQALGLEVEQQPFYAQTWLGSGQAAPNVIGIQRGTLYPDTYVVCGSHFDSFSWEAYNGGQAPGADDNATGVASVLESARIMTQYEFEYSIIYCAYGCEEMGLYGSEAYASRCQQEGMDIIGYFNNDMNGYLYGDQIHIDCIYPNSVAPIGTYYMNVGEVYYPELPIRHVNFNEGDSDHTSFNNHGYMGIYPFEDYEHYSPYIHTPNDVIGTSVTSFEMSQQYCQMNIACLAEIANPMGEMGTLTFDVDTLLVSHSATLTIFNNTEMDIVTLNRITIDEEYAGFYSFECDGQYFGLDEEVSIGINRGDSIQLEVIEELVGKNSFVYPVLYFENTLETVSLVTSVDLATVSEQDASCVQLFPNPVENQLNIKADGLQRIAVYNAMGQLVKTVEVGGKDEIVLQVSDCPSGLYTVQVVTANGVVTKSVIVR